MATDFSIIDYAQVKTSTFTSFLPIETDYAIFAHLSYFNYGLYLPLFGDSVNPHNYHLLLEEVDPLLKRVAYKDKDFFLVDALRKNPRYSEVIVEYHDEVFDHEKKEQFSATSFFIPSLNRIVISYRGTDSSLIGWREDFDMSFLCPIPAQNEALNYLLKVASLSDASIVLVGHSKGGNLACYAYLMAPQDIKARILSVYSFDGPGLNDAIVGSELINHDDKVFHYIPYESIIGGIYGSPSHKIVVSSRAHLLDQHSLYNWRVSSSGLFIKETKMSPFFERMEEYFNVWVKEISPIERKLLVDSIYELTLSSDIPNAVSLAKRKATSLKRIYDEYKKLDESKKKQLSGLFDSLKHTLYEGLK
jgi:hypothetical protein